MTIDTTRLHISPCTPALLDAVLPPAVRPVATEISFHSIQTFPERSYGYVSLPAMEAEKLKKKLNGSILKGEKFTVQVAHPRKQRGAEAEEDVMSEGQPVTQKMEKKRKANDAVLEGYELPPNRQVKRGWTAPVRAGKRDRKPKADQKQTKNEPPSKPQTKSKYTEKAECLFRTHTQPNQSCPASTEAKAKNPKENKPPEVVIVHEFSKTIAHPSFLKSQEMGKNTTASFVEGKGWLDPEGNLKEPITKKITRPTDQPGQKAVSAKTWKPETTDQRLLGGGLVFGQANSTSDELSEASETDWTSSSGTSDEDIATSDSENGDVTSAETSDHADLSDSLDKGNGLGLKRQTNKQGILSTTDPYTEQAASQADIHPLEALFKRPPPSGGGKPTLEIDTQFTFFDGNNDDGEGGHDSRAPKDPQTPFTKQDLQMRGVRSAAPTPDTALPGRARFWQLDDDDDDDNDNESGGKDGGNAEDTPTASRTTSRASHKTAESDFAKWFWEHRGENNRAWKRRRREAAKEQRQRENRDKGRKGRA